MTRDQILSTDAYVQLQRELRASYEGLQLQIEGVDQRTSRQYDILNKTLMALIQRDHKEYSEQITERKARQLALDAELSEIRHDQRINRAVQVSTLIVMIIALSLWIGARFL